MCATGLMEGTNALITNSCADDVLELCCPAPPHTPQQRQQRGDQLRSIIKTATREAATLVAAPVTLRGPVASIAAPCAALAAELLTVYTARSS